MLTAKLVTGMALLVWAVAGCAPNSPAPSPDSSPLESTPAGMPAGQPISIDIGVEISADNLVVTLGFIGGPILPATNPCHTEYAGWAKPAGDVLEVAVVLVPMTTPTTQTPVACAAVGADRAVRVTLDDPFLGSTAHDVRFGTTIPIERH